MTEQKYCEECGRRLTEKEQHYLGGLCCGCEMQIIPDFSFDDFSFEGASIEKTLETLEKENEK